MNLPSAIQPLLTVVTYELPQQLGDTLVGIYVYGSAVWGDFDEDISDIDLLVVCNRDIDIELFAQLDAWHQLLAARFPVWAGRIEIAYISTHALHTFKTQQSPIAVISPGEPFNIKAAGIDWLINWYTIRNQSVVLSGRPPDAIIPKFVTRSFVRVCAGRWANGAIGLAILRSHAHIKPILF
jgi:predicted nucleotidyltransferase